VSNLGVKTLLLTLAGFIAIYTTLLIIEMKLMLKAIRKGPEAEHAPDEGDARSHVPPAAHAAIPSTSSSGSSA
jgi:cytochrome d ubiquinol oxidase subunit I